MPFEKMSDCDEREILPGYRARFVHAEHMTLAFWHIEAGAAMPTHTHPHEQVSVVQEGRFELILDGETRVVEPGVVAVMPAGVPHGGVAITECRIVDSFHPVREDYLS